MYRRFLMVVPAFLYAQFHYGVSLGPQVVFSTYVEPNATHHEIGWGGLVGGSFAYSVSKHVDLGAELFLSYEKLQEHRQLLVESPTHTYRYRVIEDFADQDFFLKVSVTARYTHAVSSQVQVEAGAGLQPYFWMLSHFSGTVEEDHDIDFQDPQYPTIFRHSEEGSHLARDPKHYRRVGASLIMVGGVRIAHVGVYVSYDPMLTSLVRSGHGEYWRQNGLDLLLTYWIGGEPTHNSHASL